MVLSLSKATLSLSSEILRLCLRIRSMPSREGRFALRIADAVTPEVRLIILICKLSMGDLTKVCIDANIALL